ncbi:hypothetical protein B0T14DRAFT_256554 [Immersiella caudata]|uniref:Uncharacterized protein n=1 Tax=Immersiella caudata TaxID=314043 RepID=A0AA39WKJ8_9PEZI|nr:hypothetical protein B0T14DRAFT_256554 [Immersiella caudata]
MGVNGSLLHSHGATHVTLEDHPTWQPTQHPNTITTSDTTYLPPLTHLRISLLFFFTRPVCSTFLYPHDTIIIAYYYLFLMLSFCWFLVRIHRYTTVIRSGYHHITELRGGTRNNNILVICPAAKRNVYDNDNIGCGARADFFLLPFPFFVTLLFFSSVRLG